MAGPTETVSVAGRLVQQKGGKTAHFIEGEDERSVQVAIDLVMNDPAVEYAQFNGPRRVGNRWQAYGTVVRRRAAS